MKRGGLLLSYAFWLISGTVSRGDTFYVGGLARYVRMVPHSSTPPLILTLALDAVSFAKFDALRKQHFPPERNWLPAHLTLFHALPGSEEAAILDVLEEVCSQQNPSELEVRGVRSLGRGVAYEIQSSGLELLRRDLAVRWKEWLTPQDRQGFRAHVTVQNKAAPETARALHGKLVAEFVPWRACGEGLLLWRYLGGPWELLRECSFEKRPS